MAADLITLRIRDSQDIKVTRDALTELPESVLLCLFPNGVVLSPPSNRELDGDGSDQEPEETYWVDFDAQCLEFVLAFFDKARRDFYGPNKAPGDGFDAMGSVHSPLFHRQAIIVLREELDFFVIPSSITERTTDANGTATPALNLVKRECGRHLLERRSIFTALQRNVAREGNAAEQHLIDMLCMSGFHRDDEWGYRAVEPGRCCITSIALVLLKTGISHPQRSSDTTPTDLPSPGGTRPGVTVNAAQLATASKLLRACVRDLRTDEPVFHRKPARKCWWDSIVVDLAADPIKSAQSQDTASTNAQRPIKVWARRVWTLGTTAAHTPLILGRAFHSLM